MNVAEVLDYAAKTLTVVSTALYLLGYIDAGVFLSAVAAAAAMMSTLLIHRMGSTLKSYAAEKRMQRLHRLQSAAEEETLGTPAEILENLLKSLLKIHRQLEELAAEKIAVKTPARDILAISKARLEVVVKIKDLIVVLEKIRPSTGEKDLSELLRELVEEPSGSSTQSP